MQTHDLGNNESAVVGMARNADGTYTALTRTESKADFKTEGGAIRWLARRGYDAEGNRVK